MSRSKVIDRRQWANAGVNDTLSSDVIKSLLSLPSSLSSQHILDSSLGERPLKRAKTTGAIRSICISRGQLSISRPYTGENLGETSETFTDVGQYVKLSIRDGCLSMSLRPPPPSRSALVMLSLRSGELHGRVRDIIQIGESKSRSAAPGAIWITVDLSVNVLQGAVACLDLRLELRWNETSSPYFSMGNAHNRASTQRLIDTFFPFTDGAVDDAARSPMDFYEASFVPLKNDDTSLAIKVPGLESTLFPYQKRTLHWLLLREGVEWSNEDSRLRRALDESAGSAIQNFRTVVDADGHEVHLSDLCQVVTSDTTLYRQAERSVKGGILAEEMGLGKTLEILALILLHSRPKSSVLESVSNGSDLIPSRATLIIAPEPLRPQWLSEVSRHAPSLRMQHYRGCKKISQEQADAITQDLADCDVVVTTYSVLSTELHFALEAPQRSRRYERSYPRLTSPLVRIFWWRLCLDEAQMIENGYTQAAAVARVIPRVNAWGITGTPVKDDVKDLYGLLLFLRYEPYSSAPAVWQKLIRRHKSIFQQIFNSLSLRHTKALVRDEISLPLQRRYVISMPFTAVEEQHYQSLYREMAQECGMDLSGAPIIEDWRPDDYEDLMRTWLTRLRQTTLHPEVGVYSRRLLGSSKARPIRTVEEVLDAMLEQSESAIRTDERAYLLSRLARGQLFENSPRVGEALEIWEQVRIVTEKMVSDARARLENAHEGGGTEAADNAEANSSDALSEFEGGRLKSEGKGLSNEQRRRLRSALELHHKAVFFCANAYFQIRDNAELTEVGSEDFERLKKLEDDGYEEAKVVRREILQESNRKARRLMNRFARKAANRSFVDIPELATKAGKGLESGHVADKLEMLYGELNEQANVLDGWREEVVQLLLKPLVDEEDDVETTGEELGESAKLQDLLMVYVQALRAAISDRQDAVTGQVNELARHEAKSSVKLAEAGDGPAPEKMLELLRKRAEIKPCKAKISMRGAIGELRALQMRLARDTGDDSREALESRLVAGLLRETLAQLSAQNKAVLALESEIEAFKTAMNARLEYYRQLQAVSDAVLPYKGLVSEEVMARMQQTEDDLLHKLTTAEAKHRYLLNLKKSGSDTNEARLCVICQMPFVMGVLTVCGHQFCKQCMTLWFKAHRNCPVCKRGLKLSNLHDISIKPQQLRVKSEGEFARPVAAETRPEADSGTSRNHSGECDNREAAPRIYSDFNAEKLAEIQRVELDGPSYTTKVDTLVRHLMWLREADPGAKSIIFSQYRDFLGILRNAFRRFGIGHASIDEAGGIASFKEDASVECFLLHARAHSSGLNLVNASHVFLCEPLLNTALELQAIARVDRIGQQQETTVWLYLVAGTVEESIYRLSVRRRIQHLGGRTWAGRSRQPTPELLEAANTLELEQAALSKLMSRDKSAGELVDKGDLWECLFGHVGAGES